MWKFKNWFDGITIFQIPKIIKKYMLSIYTKEHSDVRSFMENYIGLKSVNI